MPYKDEVRARAARMKNSIHQKQAVKVAYGFITNDRLEAMLKGSRMCPCCGVVMLLKFDRYDGRCMTIDRVIPAAGYVEGNIQIICACCNQAKSDSTLKELQQLCTYIETYQPAEVIPLEPDASFNIARFKQKRREEFKGVS